MHTFKPPHRPAEGYSHPSGFRPPQNPPSPLLTTPLRGQSAVMPLNCLQHIPPWQKNNFLSFGRRSPPKRNSTQADFPLLSPRSFGRTKAKRGGKSVRRNVTSWVTDQKLDLSAHSVLTQVGKHSQNTQTLINASYSSPFTAEKRKTSKIRDRKAS